MRATELEIMGILGVVSTHGANLCTEMHLARQFKPRVAIAMPPKEVRQDSDTVHLGGGKRCTAISRFELAIDVRLCRISGKLVQVLAILKLWNFCITAHPARPAQTWKDLTHSIRFSNRVDLRLCLCNPCDPNVSEITMARARFESQVCRGYYTNVSRCSIRPNIMSIPQ
jgi:hypothetical protein